MSTPALGPKAKQLCELLGVEVPIVQAPMAGGWTTAELVAGAANAGALGMIAAARLSAEQLRSILTATRQKTDRPFGVNFLMAAPEPFDGESQAVQAVLNAIRAEFGLPAPEAKPKPAPPPSLDELLEIALEAKVSVVSFAMGNPARFADRIHARGALLFATATTVQEAVDLEGAGADVIVAQGAEAGGHRSTYQAPPGSEFPLVGTMVLVPTVADRVRRPVLASGGVMDGRGLLAALALGASGVQMGTRFLATAESGAYPSYKQKLLTADATDTLVSRLFSGRPARGIRNRLIQALERAGVSALPWPHQSLAAVDLYGAAMAGDLAEIGILLAGQGAALARPGQSAAQVIAEVMGEAQRLLADLTRNG